jgi:hypothetical protein
MVKLISLGLNSIDFFSLVYAFSKKKILQSILLKV